MGDRQWLASVVVACPLVVPFMTRISRLVRR
jgi:hypothetical protein